MAFKWTILALVMAAGTSTSLFANPKVTYQIRTELYVDGKMVASPTVVTPEGTSASISQASDDQEGDKFTVGMVATEQSTQTLKDGIHLKLNVEYKNGVHSGKFNSEVLTASGKQATIKTNKGAPNEGVEIKVTATRQ